MNRRARRRALCRHSGPTLLRDAAVLLGVFAGVTLIAELLGAANLGVAIGVATIAYAVALDAADAQALIAQSVSGKGQVVPGKTRTVRPERRSTTSLRRRPRTVR